MRSVLGAAGAAAYGVLPLSLLGAMAVLVRPELGFAEDGLGVAVAFFFLASGSTSSSGGRLVSFLGPRRGVLLAGILGGCSLAGVALVTTNWMTLVIFLVLGGMAHGIAQPASSLALAQLVSTKRQGIAFGVKQSATAVSGLFAGLAVPLVALNYGWRSVFGAAAVLAVVPWLLLPRTEAAQPRPRIPTHSKVVRPWLLLLAVGWAFGAMGVAGLAVFLVEAAVASGIPVDSAGLILALGSTAGIASRIGAGILVDRHPEQALRAVVAMLLAGSLALGVLAVSNSDQLFVVGTILAYAFAWGWPGLFQFAVVRLFPDAPAEAIGITQTGLAFGSVLGPIGLGILIVEVSYSATWIAAAGCLVLAAGFVESGRRRIPDGTAVASE